MSIYTRISESKRRKVSRRDRKRKRVDKKLKGFRLEFVDFVGDPLDKNILRANDWYRQSNPYSGLVPEERVERILSHINGRSQVTNRILRFYTSKIRKFLIQTFGKTKHKLNKEAMTKALVSKFFDGVDPEFLKRELEEDALEDFDTDDFRNLQSVQFGKTYVSLDLIHIILSFFYYDRFLLTKIGSVCKGFYISILCTWPRVCVKKTNLNSISLLVLQNIRSLRIEAPGSNSFLNRGELEYLLTHLSSNRLQSITLVGTISTYRSFLLGIKRFSTEKKKNPFQNVTEVVFKLHIPNFSKISSSISRIKRLPDDYLEEISPITTIFPSLTSFSYPDFLSMISGQPIKKLKFDTRDIVDDNSTFSVSKPKHSYKSLYTPERFRKYQVNVNSITTLNLITDIDLMNKNDSFLHDLFPLFKNVRYLDLSLGISEDGDDVLFIFPFQKPSVESPSKTKVDLSFLRTMPQLSKLSIVKHFDEPPSMINRSYYKLNIERVLLLWERQHNWVSSFFHPEQLSSSNFPLLSNVTILTDLLIDSKGVLNLLTMKKMESVRLIFLCGKDDDLLDDIVRNVPNIPFVHLEIKVCKKLYLKKREMKQRFSGNQLNSTSLVQYFNKFQDHLLLIERDILRKKFFFGVLSYSGIPIKSTSKRGERKSDVQKMKKKIVPPVFKTIEHITDPLNFEKLTKGVSKVQIVFKDTERKYILDWKELNNTILRKMKFKRDRLRKGFNLGLLDVNKYRGNVENYVGRNSSSRSKTKSTVCVQEFNSKI